MKKYSTSLVEKCKLEPQLHTTIYTLKYLYLKRQNKNVVKDVEQ